MRWGPLLLAMVACGGESPPTVVSLVGETMGTYYSIRYIAPGDPDEAVRTRRSVEELLDAVNARFSTYRPDSLISRLNAHRTDEPFAVDVEFGEVLALALRIAAASGGAYDPTVLPLVRALDFGPDADESAPSADEVAAARARVDFRNVELVEGPAVRKRDALLEIDLSSIAKGAGVDRVSALLASLGFPSHMVEIGGEVVCRGQKPGDEPWRIGIERPATGSGVRDVESVVELRDRAIATSGSYRNFRESGGARMHHVLDARTGINAPNGVVSVSVTAPSCALADGLATALMVVGPEGARGLLDAFPEVELGVLFLMADGDGTVRELPIGWR